jgi:TolB-like protein/DNA-binding SARP family transcriptional activator/Flp pilus assembly protein TadD
MTAAQLRLLGGFEVRSAVGQLLDLSGQKDRALLAFLALPPGAIHSREKLASLLWGDRGDQQARDSLKHALTRIRQCLQSADPSPVVADRQFVRLDPDAVMTDVATLEQLAREGTAEALEQATALYRGDLLDGIGIRDPAFEDWLVVERQRLRHLIEEALTKLLNTSTAAGMRERAATAARRLLSLDPLRETACRALMQIHAEQAQTAQALKLYETLRDRLHRELGVKPEPETMKLYESIKQRRSDAPPTAAAPPSALTEEPPKPGGTGLSLPSKPSIAVLPFENLSGDSEQEYFADGMVEEIITALSRIPRLFVIARNSSFTYKGRAVDVKQVGRDLGVRYVLEGSVRKSGNRVRITGQLVDASMGVHLWADRFDGELTDIFDLQDRVTASVVGAIAPKLEQAEIERAKRKPTESLDAYDYFLRGMSCVHRWTREANAEALQHFAQAIRLDPEFAAAYGMAARCYSQGKVSRWLTDPARDTAEAERLSRRAAELGADDPVALHTAGMALAYVVGDLDGGAALVDRSVALNPNLAWGWLFSAWVRVWMGQTEMALEHVARAMRLSPHDPQFHNMQAAAGAAHFFAGRHAEAASWIETAARAQPNHIIAASIVAGNRVMTGQLDEARAAMARLRQLDPSLRVSNLRELIPLRRPEALAMFADVLRKAGLPE